METIYAHFTVDTSKDDLERVQPPIGDREAEKLLRQLMVDRGLEDHRTLAQIATEYVVRGVLDAPDVLDDMRAQPPRTEPTSLPVKS